MILKEEKKKQLDINKKNLKIKFKYINQGKQIHFKINLILKKKAILNILNHSLIRNKIVILINNINQPRLRL